MSAAENLRAGCGGVTDTTEDNISEKMSSLKNDRVPKACSEGVENMQAFETYKEIISSAPSNNDEDKWDYSYDSDPRCYPRPGATSQSQCKEKGVNYQQDPMECNDDPPHYEVGDTNLFVIEKDSSSQCYDPSTSSHSSYEGSVILVDTFDELNHDDEPDCQTLNYSIVYHCACGVLGIAKEIEEYEVMAEKYYNIIKKKLQKQ